jgi:hypothetical protein
VNDDEIRALVRVAIEKHLGTGSPDDRRGRSSAFAHSASADKLDPPVAPVISLSFGRYTLPRAEGDTMCLIEPAVRCNHCGYCECHGH